MFAVRNLFRSNAQLVKNVSQQRNMSAIAVPPRKNVSKGELIVLGAGMFVGWLTIPAWVVLNMKHYRGN